jgi:hypothetical protein
VVKELKKLTMVELNKQNKKLDGQQEFLVSINDTDYKMTHDLVFRITKQQKLLEDLLRFLESIGSENIEVLEMATPYTGLLILKHFTSLDVSDDIDEALTLMQVLIDLGVFSAMINALPEDELTKVFELVTETVENVKNNIEESAMEAERVINEEEIENEEISNLLKSDEEVSVEEAKSDGEEI